jgi:hypothetical protein
MRTSVVARCLIVIALGALLALAQGPVPSMKAVDPSTAKAGDVLTVTGENLDRANVAEVYLTDGKTDFKTPIEEQAAEAIKIKVPASAKPGRLALMILTQGKDQKLIEQPVKVTIEE